MPEIKVPLPEDLHREVQAHPEIDWSELPRHSIRRTLDHLHIYDRLLAESKLTEEDAAELGREIRRSAAQRRRR